MRKRSMLLLAAAAIGLAAATAASAAGTGEATSPAAKPYEILWYQIFTPQKDTDVVFEKVSEYTRQKIGATVKMVMIDWGEYNTRMPIIMASGEKLDLTFTASWANNFRENAANGAFLPLNDLLAQYGKDILKTEPKAFLDGASIGGKIYAIPINKEIGGQWAYIFNAELVKKYGFDLRSVKGWKDIEPFLKVIREQEPTNYDLSIGRGGESGAGPATLAMLPFERIVEYIPGSLYYDNRTKNRIVNEFETPEMKDYLATMRRWYTAGYIRKDAPTVDNPDTDGPAKNWFVLTISYTPYAEVGRETSWRMGIDYAPVMKPVATTGSVTGSMQAISKATQNAGKTMEFLNLLYVDQYLNNLIGYGIEGTHWVRKDANHIGFPAGVDGTNRTYDMARWCIGSMYLNYLWEGEPVDKWQKYQEFNAASVASPGLGFSFAAGAVDAEIAAVRNVWAEFIPALATGSVDPDEYLSKMLAKMKAAGMDEIIAEEQRQFDAFQSSRTASR